MDSPQSIVSPFKTSDSPQSIVSPFKTSVVAEPEKHKSDTFVQSCSGLSKGETKTKRNEPITYGVLEVYVHQARDIHNICIYHKQDVYAKLCLTTDPKTSVSTKTINGGGRNPVFNDNVQLNVQTVDTSLKCELYMMSRVKNYLEDQLLGFALVPLSEVLLTNGKLEKEFSLSSSDLFHSPAGFVELSLSYSGTSPDVISLMIPTNADVTTKSLETPESHPNEMNRIEFPDPNVLNQNQMMVSEYFEMSESSESLATSDGVSIHVPESCFEQTSKMESSPSSVLTNGVSSPSVAASSNSYNAEADSKTPIQEHTSGPTDKGEDVENSNESDSSNGLQSETFTKSVVNVSIEPEVKMVEQDIVDMYMKSMQQFTESLAKMKLPLDMSSPTNSENSSSDQNLQASKNAGSRVFYGSRAFF